MMELVSSPLGQFVLLVIGAMLARLSWRKYAARGDSGPALFYEWRRDPRSPQSIESGDRAARPDRAPRIVPVRFGHRHFPWTTREQGLFVENLGQPARDVVAQPITIGGRVVTFSAGEGGEIEDNGPVSFFKAHVEGSQDARRLSAADAFYGWQSEQNNIGREGLGTITFSDTDGRLFQTVYRITIDALNTDSGLAVEFVEQRPVDRVPDLRRSRGAGTRLDPSFPSFAGSGTSSSFKFRR